MKRGVFFVLLVIGVVAMALSAGSALAAAGGNSHTVTQTDNFHGFQQTTDTNPCTGNTVDLSETSNIVNHMTYFPGGDEVWGTFTEEDKVTAVDEEQAGLHGPLHSLGQLQRQRAHANDTFTLSIHVTSADGVDLLPRSDPRDVNANGTLTVSFDKPSLTCGG